MKTVQLVTQNTPNVTTESEYPLFTVTTSNIAPIMITVDKEIHMELDTGQLCC